MALPQYFKFYHSVLSVIQDGRVYTNKEIREAVKMQSNFSEDDLKQLLGSGRKTVFEDRIGWAITYLKKAGLIEAQSRGHLNITKKGSDILSSGVEITNSLLADISEDFRQFVKVSPDKDEASAVESKDGQDGQVDLEETPEATLEQAYKLINAKLADELLETILAQSPSFFEQLVVDLMKAMDYGDGFVTKYSGDDGIDGIVHEDKLGFNLIYIQAKRWKPDVTIGKPELQKFAGAMMGPPRVEKGLFITTAKFSPKARDFANAQHIILVDGKRLTELMIEYGVGVSTQKAYLIKRVDSDYFSDN